MTREKIEVSWQNISHKVGLRNTACCGGRPSDGTGNVRINAGNLKPSKFCGTVWAVIYRQFEAAVKRKGWTSYENPYTSPSCRDKLQTSYTVQQPNLSKGTLSRC